MNYTQLDQNTGVMTIYGHITEWWNSAEEFKTLWDEMERKFTNINVRMHCYGGSVFEGTVIYNIIANSKCFTTGIVEGVAASMGSIMLQAFKKRVIADNGFVMIHRPSGYTEGDADVHRNTANLLSSMEKNFIKTYSRKSGKPEAEVKKYLDGQDHWLSAEEAKEAGLVDEITEPVVTNINTLGKPDAKGDIKDIYGRYAAQLLSPPVNTISKTNNDKMKKELIARFNLKGVDENSTDSVFFEALGKHFDELIQANQKLVNDQVEAVIKAAETVKGAPYDKGTRDAFAAIGSKLGIDHLQTVLGVSAAVAAPVNPAAAAAAAVTAVNNASAAVATPRVVNLIDGSGGAVAGGADRTAWTWDDYQKNDPDALVKMEKENRPAFAALYKAKYKADPA